MDVMWELAIVALAQGFIVAMGAGLGLLLVGPLLLRVLDALAAWRLRRMN